MLQASGRYSSYSYSSTGMGIAIATIRKRKRILQASNNNNSIIILRSLYYNSRMLYQQNDAGVVLLLYNKQHRTTFSSYQQGNNNYATLLSFYQQQRTNTNHSLRYFSYMRLYDSLSGKIIPLSDHLTKLSDDDNNNKHNNNFEQQQQLKIQHEQQQQHANQQQQTKEQQQQQQIGLACYTCGPTTYAPSHIGHARTYVVLDILRRCIEATSTIPPLFVMNITDIDDKILNAASTVVDESNNLTTSPIELARKYENEFWYDMDCLNVLRPHYVTRVTEHIESDIIPYIQRIIDNGMAYEIVEADDNNNTSDDFPGIYFDVQEYIRRNPDIPYDKFSLNRFDNITDTTAQSINIASTSDVMIGRQGSKSQQQQKPTTETKKRDGRDFVLWKKRKQNETIYWESPFGQGRPGWHIECSAMIESVQRQFQTNTTDKSNNHNDDNNVLYKFILHCGGIDLQFPHHTNEIAQANAYHYTNSNPCSSHDHQHDSTCAMVHGNTHEWIPHWVHTGHLHIAGLKMSKSLKNFITIQEMLSCKLPDHPNDSNHDDNVAVSSYLQSNNNNNNNNAFIAPADDFRLWCLGLSGSYRNAATYSDDRRKEAMIIRRKIIRFLIDGEAWLQKHNNRATSIKKWRQQDYNLIQLTSYVAVQSRNGLFDNDLDGSICVEQMIKLSEIGSTYLRNERTMDGPSEPIIYALRTVRDLLSLVGFTDRTCRAGMIDYDTTIGSSNDSNSSRSNVVVGGERALLNEFVRFRSSIRNIVISAIQQQKKKEGTTTDTNNIIDPSVITSLLNILQLCDEARDTVFPAMGIELLDGRTANSSSRRRNSSSEDDVSNANDESDWRSCEPRLVGPSTTKTIPVKSEEASTSSNVTFLSAKELSLILPLEYFRVGQYEGQFSEYDNDGIPTKNSDGTDISNRQRKKYQKKLEKHTKQWQENK